MAAATLALAGCGEPSVDPDAPKLEAQAPPEELQLVNSGETLTGVYTLESPAPPLLAATITFTPEGEFERSRTIAGERGARKDSGSYVIETGGRLVLWVERSGDAMYSSAVPEQYEMGGDRRTAIELGEPSKTPSRYVRNAATGSTP
jgi:hypothetical protein